MLRTLTTLVAVLAISGTVFSQTSNWTGTNSNVWNDPGNWDAGVPTAATTVVIPSSAAAFPSLYTTGPSCNDLTIDSGASLTLSSGWDLSVSAGLTIDGTLTVTSTTSNIAVIGGWVNNGTFTDGGSTVTLNGTASLGGSSSTTFQNLTVASGTRTLSTAMSVDGDLELATGSGLDLGSLTHTVAGNWTSSGGSITVTGTGTIEFTGDGQFTTLTNSVPNVLISGGTRSMNTSTISGDLGMTGGTLQVLDFAVVAVTGDANLSGGTLAFSGLFNGLDILDVEGAVTLTSTAGTSNADSVIRVAGAWSSTSAWTPGSGTVEMDGAGAGTIGGASPTFAGLQILSGTRTAGAATVGGDLTVDAGASLVSTGVADVNGDVSLGTTGSWDLGASTHTVDGDWISAGGSATGAGGVDFDGDGVLDTGTATISNVTVSSGTRTANTSAVTGDVALTGGTLLVGDDQTFSIAGNANFSAGTLSWPATAVGFFDALVVDGNATVTSTFGTGSTFSRFRVGGDWSSTSAFNPTAGAISFDSGSAANIGGTAPVFHDLAVSNGSKTLTAAATVSGSLSVASGHTLTLSGVDLAVTGDATVAGTLALNSQVLEVTGDFTSIAGGAVVSGPGTLEFTGVGTTNTGSNAVPDVLVSAGTRSFATSSIAGNLDASAGTVDIGDNATLTVSGDVSFAVGSTLGFIDTTGGFETLDVAGDVNLSATSGTTTANTLINCTGNWTSDANWVPLAGRVRLTGGAATANATNLPDLLVLSGVKTLTAATLISGNVSVSTGATLDADAALDVDGNVILANATAVWDMGTSTHTVAGDFTSSGGTAIGTGAIAFDGTGTLATGGGSISNVEVTGGTRTAFATSITGDLGLSGTGILLIGDDATVSVTGDANLLAGTLSWFGTPSGGFDLLDVGGNVTLSAAWGGGSSLSRFRCAGDWSSTSAFAPLAGSVSLDGGSATTVGGASPTFFDLAILDGDKTINAATSVANDLVVASGQTLTLSGADASVAGDATVAGSLVMGGQTLTVAGDWTSDGGGAVLTGPGTIEWSGTGTSLGGVNVLPDVLVSGGVRTLDTLVLGGDLDVTAGTVAIADNRTVTVAGAATLAVGSTLSFLDTTGGFEVLDIEGAVICSATSGTTSANSLIDAAGDWTSDANWVPVSGRVRFDGGTTATVSATNLPTVVVLSGTKTVSVPSSVSGNLSVSNGAQLVASAAIGVAGSVSLGDGTSGWDLGTSTHTVAGDWVAVGGSATGLGTVEFTGPGALSTSSGSISNVDITAGLRTAADSDITGDLSMSGTGTLLIDDDTTVSVGGNANLTGGTLSWVGTTTGGFDVLDVAGDATIMAAFGGGSTLSRLRVAGNWASSSAFTPTVGVTSLDGASATSIGGTDPTFFDLSITDGSKTIVSNASVDGALSIDALQTLTLSLADVSVAGDVNVLGTFDMAGQTATVAGDWSSDAVGSVLTGPGTIDLTADGTLSTGANTVPGVTISGGVRTVTTSTIDGPLDVTGGTLQIADNSTVLVTGTATMALGTTLAFDDTSAGLETLDLDGDADIAATAGAMTNNTIIECSGNWISDAAFVPAGSRVRFDGGTVATIDGPSFGTVIILDGVKTMNGAATLSGNLNLASGASLVTGAALDIDGDVSLLDATASWAMGAFNHQVFGNWTSTGASATGTGTIEFDGTGTLDTGTGAIGNALVSDGTRTILGATISGDLAMTGLSTLFIEDDGTLNVDGNLNLSGGTLEWFGTGTGFFDVIDVAGDATITAAFGGGSSFSRLLVGGNWSSSSAFNPAAGQVSLNGGTVSTIGGASPTFFDVSVSSGDKTAVSNVAVGGNLTVVAGQSFTLSAADLSVDGAVTVAGSLDLGGQTATVIGSWTSSGAGASVAGPGTIVFTGTGTLATGANSVPDIQVTSGLRSAATSTLAGDLDVSGGTLSILNNSTVTVAGNATLTGSTLTFVDTSGGFEILDVEGDVLLTAASGGSSANSIIDCAGNWTSDGTWVPSSGRVRFDGGLATVSGTNFSTVTIVSGTKTFTTGSSITGSLSLISGAILDTDAAIDVDGNAILGDGSSSWDVGSFVHTVGGDWLSSGASALGLGSITFDGPGSLTTGGGTISNATVAAGLRTSQNATIAGDLALTGAATLLIDNDSTLMVGGDANLSGGTLRWFGTPSGFQDILEVAGNATVTSTYGGGSSLARFRVGGDWSSTAAFSPTAGAVQLDGGSVATVGGTNPVFFDLAVSSGTKTLDADATIGGDLQVSAGQTLILSGADIDVADDVTISGTLDMGSRTVTVVGDWISSTVGAAVTGPGTIMLTGAGVLATGVNTIPDVLSTNGSRSVSTTAVDGSLLVSGGTLLVQDNASVSVSGNASFGAAAVLAFTDTSAGFEVLDVEGDVTMTSVSGTTSVNTLITCGGSWSANGTWAPGNGTVRLDGGGITSLTGLAPDFTHSFQTLVIENGVRELTTDVTFDVASLLVAVTGELRTQGNQAVVPGIGGSTPVTIDGALNIGAGGGVAMGNPVNMTVSGTLAMNGSFGSEAQISGDGGGGYTLSVLGTLDASHFRFGGMDGNGVIISPSAVILDMDPGRFENPSPAAGSSLLNISRLTPAQFRYVDFLGAATGTFNTSSLFGSPIEFVNSSGDLSGEAFDNDPSGLVTWTTGTTTLVGFSGTGGVTSAALSWETSTEVDVTDYIVQRATSPGGPFTTVNQQSALGAGFYGYVDNGLNGSTDYTYRLLELLSHGATRLLGTTGVSTGGLLDLPSTPQVTGIGNDRAQRKGAPALIGAPLMPNPGLGSLANSASVTDLSGALANIAGVLNPVIRVAPGTYPAFEIEPVFEGTLRVLADGTGPVLIDTTEGPVRIAGLDASRSVELSDLLIGSAGTLSSGLLIEDNLGLVVLDETTVTGGSGLPAMEIFASTRVALQRSTAMGSVSVAYGSSLTVGGGSLGLLQVSGNSLVRTAGVSPALPVVESGSSLVEFGSGPHADVELPEFVVLGKPFTVTLKGAPGSRYALVVSPELGWTDAWSAGDKSQEMVSLLDQSLAQVVLFQTFDGSGQLEFTVTLPTDADLLGRPMAVQMVTEDASTGTTRWSNTAAFVPLAKKLGGLLSPPADDIDIDTDTGEGDGTTLDGQGGGMSAGS